MTEQGACLANWLKLAGFRAIYVFRPYTRRKCLRGGLLLHGDDDPNLFLGRVTKARWRTHESSGPTAGIVVWIGLLVVQFVVSEFFADHRMGIAIVITGSTSAQNTQIP
jgi:hypothetical protein